MEIKERIENLLLSLKKLGVDRRTIEKDMIYAEYYIDQILSKGGNKKFLKRLEKYYIEKSNPLNKPPVLAEITAKLVAAYERIIELQKQIGEKKAPDITDTPKNVTSPLKKVKPK